MRTFFPTLLIIAALGLFFTFTDSTYTKVKELKTKVADLNDALGRSKEILKKRTDLQNQYKSFSARDLESIEKLLPNNVDNIQLILDINGIARNHGMVLKGIKIGGDQTASANTTATASQTSAAPRALGPDKSTIGSLTLSFNVSASYEDFISFIKDLEQSLRIVDITSLSFKVSDTGPYQYAVTIKTYWLK